MMTRRGFLHRTGSLAAAGWLLSLRESGADEALRASQLVEGKDDALLILSRTPRVLETPVRLLDKHLLTPKSQLFVRNNFDPGGFATTAAASRVDWTVDLTGLVEGDAQISAEALAMLPQTEYEQVLQCSGNSRNLFSAVSPISGTPWGRGGIGNVRFAGPLLSVVLKHLQRTPAKLARFVCGEGRDQPADQEPDFEHSLPLGDALETTILAITLNGEPMPAVHGGPVRLVTPGYYGTVQMKWLSRLRFEAAESPNLNHADRYRTPQRVIAPGATYKFNLENSSPTWRMKIASLITSHLDGDRVPAGRATVSGFAWNDGLAPLAGVLLSLDRGETWRRVPLELAASPYAWSRWTAEISLGTEPQPVWITAVDHLGRTQPLDGSIYWNPRGYEWNGVEKITLLPA